MIYAVIGLFLLPLYGMAKKVLPKKNARITTVRSCTIETGPEEGFVYLFLIRSIDPLCSWKVIIGEVHPLNTGLAG